MAKSDLTFSHLVHYCLPIDFVRDLEQPHISAGLFLTSGMNLKFSNQPDSYAFLLILLFSIFPL